MQFKGEWQIGYNICSAARTKDNGWQVFPKAVTSNQVDLASIAPAGFGILLPSNPQIIMSENNEHFESHTDNQKYFSLHIN